MKLREETDDWSLAIDNGRVQMIQVDFRLSLLIVDAHDHAWLRIGTACTLRGTEGAAALIPDQATSVSPILPFFNGSVTSLTVAKAGKLVARFGNGAVLEIEPDEAYEAWELACSIGTTKYLLVCSPGGKVALFQDSGEGRLAKGSAGEPEA
jgi:hypothetical protein